MKLGIKKRIKIKNIPGLKNILYLRFVNFNNETYYYRIINSELG